MKIIILGAGGIGGYFGARMHQAGGDVSFLVRPARAGQLKKEGLKLTSLFGDLHIQPKVLTADELNSTFDVVVLSCKAYDLDSAMAAIAPAVGAATLVLPLLNGVAHLETLDKQFGRERVLGGTANIAVTLAPTGEIQHLNDTHRLFVGSRSLPPAANLAPLSKLLDNIGVDFQFREDIEQAMWDKYVFLTTLAGITASMRANIGTILKTHGGQSLINKLLNESLSVAAAYGYAPILDTCTGFTQYFSNRDCIDTSSMLRDILRGGPIEAEHIQGDMVRRAEAKALSVPGLQFVYAHLQAYALGRQ